MDETSFMSQVKAGSLLALGEYRHSKSEMLRWRDKLTGRLMEAPVLRHTVEFGNCSVAVSERVPEGTKLEDIHVPFVKGEMVVLHLEELSRNLGLVSARGKLEHFTPSPGNGAPVGGASATREP